MKETITGAANTNGNQAEQKTKPEEENATTANANFYYKDEKKDKVYAKLMAAKQHFLRMFSNTNF